MQAILVKDVDYKLLSTTIVIPEGTVITLNLEDEDYLWCSCNYLGADYDFEIEEHEYQVIN